tara:strand:- start:109 stop:222 length:114 start_codon:yes stop_codon:yes gene_type:complete
MLYINYFYLKYSYKNPTTTRAISTISGVMERCGGGRI